VHVIAWKHKVLPLGAFVEGELHGAPCHKCNCLLAHSLPFILSFICFDLLLLCFKGIVEGHYPGLMTRGDSIIHKHFMEMRRLTRDEIPFFLAMPPRATTLVW
jgi:hypothetical protein